MKWPSPIPLIACALVATLFLSGWKAKSSTAVVEVGEHYDYVNKMSARDGYLWINVIRGGVENFSPAQRGNCPSPWYAKAALSDPNTAVWQHLAAASLIGKIRVYVATGGCTTDGKLQLVALQLETD